MIKLTVLFPPDIFAFFLILSIRGVTVHLDYLDYCDQFLIATVRFDSGVGPLKGEVAGRQTHAGLESVSAVPAATNPRSSGILTPRE